MPDTVREIFTDQIDDPPQAMRSELNRDGLFELADSIKKIGLINPPTVRPKGDRFELVAGHRRLESCKIAGLLKIPCVVREMTDNQVFTAMAAENLERVDVDPVDEAIFIKRYMDQTKFSVADIAKALRRSVTYVESRLAIGEMPDYLQAHLKNGSLKLGVALALAQIDEEPKRRVWVEMAARDGISVAQADYWLVGWRMGQLPGGLAAEEPPGGYNPAVPPAIMFECAIDGKKYDARQFHTVMIWEGNVALFNAFVAEYRRDPLNDQASPILPEKGAASA